MITLGVDLAAQNKNTALCRIDWARSEAHVEPPAFGAPGEDNAWLIEEIQDALETAWIGIDAPFGWPTAMVEAIAAHAEGKGWPNVERAALRYRLTDRVLQEEHGINPLSVSSDRIAVAAWRCAQLLDSARPGLTHVRRSGEDQVIEVYPGAALKTWQLRHGVAYKGSGNKAKQAEWREQRGRLMTELEARSANGRASWLRFPDGARQQYVDNDHALDALLCALIARAAATGNTAWPESGQLATARIEGWIHLPNAACLADLVGSRLKPVPSWSD